jgi:hypothetical protein
VTGGCDSSSPKGKEPLKPEEEEGSPQSPEGEPPKDSKGQETRIHPLIGDQHPTWVKT